MPIDQLTFRALEIKRTLGFLPACGYLRNRRVPVEQAVRILAIKEIRA